MISVLIDHSYADDYFAISDITVFIKDPIEKERVENVLTSSGLEGALVNGDRMLPQRIAKILGVDVSLIDIDTNEIDLN